MHHFVLHNDDVCPASGRLLSPGQVGLLSGWGVFSTIRVIDGVLFAFERHWARMNQDAQLMNVPMPPDREQTRQALLRLVEANQAPNATLRVVVVRNNGGIWQGPSNGREYDLIALTTEIKKWGSGVNLTYQKQARHSSCMFAGTKILSWAMNLTWFENAQKRGFDEVILLNERDEVSECTSANIFAARGQQVWTPPLSSGCLPGVTRGVLMTEVPLPPGFTLSEKTLYPADLASADEVFITSTTRDLLPVEEIDGTKIRDEGGARVALQAAFSLYVDQYVTAHRAAPAHSGAR